MEKEKGEDSPYENGLEHVKEREKIIIKRKRKTMEQSKSTAAFNVH